MRDYPVRFLFPEQHTLLIGRSADDAQLIDVSFGNALQADAALAQELMAFAETGTWGPMLSALPQGTPMRTTLERLSVPATPLDGTAALRLDGFDTLFLELTGTCNEKCVHCYAESSPQVKHALSRSTCESVLRDAARLGFFRVQFTGGEPLLCRFLPELLALAVELKIPECEIYTNATLLTDSWLSSLNSCAPRFAISFYSHDSATHDRITGLPGSHEKTVEAIERIVHSGLNVRVAVILMAQNAGHGAQTIQFLRGLGVEDVSASVSHEVGRGEFFQLQETLDLTGHSPQGDGAVRARGALCVSYTGEVYPCIFNRSTPLGSVQQRSLSDIVAAPSLGGRGPLKLANYGQRLECASCRLTDYALREVC